MTTGGDADALALADDLAAESGGGAGLPDARPGAEYLRAFVGAVSSVVAWTRHHA